MEVWSHADEHKFILSNHVMKASSGCEEYCIVIGDYMALIDLGTMVVHASIQHFLSKEATNWERHASQEQLNYYLFMRWFENMNKWGWDAQW